ncbi:MAG: SDR family oxidoreductase [Verrucomicrobia bacterium]|nr:SDR family oxidoreductase [Verrucomicrobiota bacterium]MBV9673999.1 SDR family oxidoreductase [Verrucomicrobiota bacterium]
MEVRVDDKVLLVTGATQGIGRAVALEAVRSGAAAIILTGRNKQRGAEVVAEILELGAKAAFVGANLEEQDAPARVISAAIDNFGRLDGLVNSAALSDRASIADADTALFDHLFALNTRAPMFLMQGLIRHLQERKAPGSIVNILSIHAHGASIDLAIYGATKAAVSLLTKNAGFAHRKDRIRVNGINLGWTDTPGEREMQAVKLGKGESWLAEVESRMPWGRLIQPEDVARLTVFLLSDISIPMTGALIDQDQNYVLGVLG